MKKVLMEANKTQKKKKVSAAPKPQTQKAPPSPSTPSSTPAISSSPLPTAASTGQEGNHDERTQKILHVRRLMKLRDQALESNKLVKADELKQKLIEMGVFVRDQKGGPSGWRFLDGTSNKLPPGFKIPPDAVRHKRSRDESERPEEESTPTSKSENRAKKAKSATNTTTTATTGTAAAVSRSGESARNLSILREKTDSSTSSSQGQSIGQRTIESVGITDKSVGSGPEAQQGNRVKVHYVGKLKTTGKVFDASTKKPFQFRLGAGEVIRGWDIGVKGMRVGGQRTLVIPPEKAYGRHGAPPTIPGNAWLVFDVKLLEVK